MSEAEILARGPGETEAYRFAAQPEIIVVQFGSLASQADALNRAAALIEKAGFSHVVICGSAELDQRIREDGGRPEEFYYGHDYRAADLLLFLSQVEAEGHATPGEAALRRMVNGWGWRSGTNAALITLAREGGDEGIGAAARATILRHELSHGLYFVNPAYAGFAHRFWAETLTEAERGKFRAFLGREGYDTALDDLIVNETQAYLMHTADRRFFSARGVGIEPARIAALRTAFLAGMPAGWLRDRTTVPADAPRRRQRGGFAPVRRRRVAMAMRAPLRAA